MLVLANFLMELENWLEWVVCNVYSGYMDHEESIIWDASKSPTADPQITHKLCRSLSTKLLITCV